MRPVVRIRTPGSAATAVKRMLVHESGCRPVRRTCCRKDEGIEIWRPVGPFDRHGHRDRRGRRQAIRATVDEAVAQGARLLAGNVRKGRCIPPTVVDHVQPDMTLVKQRHSDRVAGHSLQNHRRGYRSALHCLWAFRRPCATVGLSHALCRAAGGHRQCARSPRIPVWN